MAVVGAAFLLAVGRALARIPCPARRSWAVAAGAPCRSTVRADRRERQSSPDGSATRSRSAPSGWPRQPDPLALGRRPPSALPGRGTAGRRRSRPHSRPATRIPTAAATRPTDGRFPPVRASPISRRRLWSVRARHQVRDPQQSAIGGNRRAVGPLLAELEARLSRHLSVPPEGVACASSGILALVRPPGSSGALAGIPGTYRHPDRDRRCASIASRSCRPAAEDPRRGGETRPQGARNSIGCAGRRGPAASWKP